MRATSSTGLAIVAAAGLALASSPASAGSRFDGLWCGTGLLAEYSLSLKQATPVAIEGVLSRGSRSRGLEGSVSGNTLRTQTPKFGAVVLEAMADGELRLSSAEGLLALAQGNSFRRAKGQSCGN